MKPLTNYFFRNVFCFILGILIGISVYHIYQINFCEKSDRLVLKSVQQKNFYRGNNESYREISELEDNILKEGNISSYNELRTTFLDKDIFAFLPWALIMSNKYSHKDAYFDVYNCIIDFNSMNFNSKQLDEKSLEGLDVETQKFVVSYLKKASEMGNSQAKEVLDIYNKQGKYQY